MKFFKDNELILKFMLINISTGIAMGMVNLVLPIYALSLNASSTQIGLIKGLGGVGDLLIVFPAGFMVDHLGSKKMYSVSAVMGSSLIVLISYISSIELLLFSMIFFGMVRSLRTTALNADFFNNMNAIGIKKGGWFKGSMSVGGALIGPVIGGMAIVAMSYKSYFALASVFLLAPFLVILARTNGGSNLPVKPKNFKLAEASNQYKALAKNRSLVSATIIEGINSAIFVTFTTFITVFIIKDLGLSPGVAAMLIALKGGATICVVFLGGQFLSRNNTNLYIFSCIVTILALFVLGVSRDILNLSIASTVLGISSGFISLVTFTQVGNIDGEKGKIAGIFTLGLGMGSIFGPTLGGMIGDFYSIQAIFLSFIPVFGIMALYIYISGKNELDRKTSTS